MSVRAGARRKKISFAIENRVRNVLQLHKDANIVGYLRIGTIDDWRQL